MISNNQNRLCCDDGWNPPFVVIAAVATGRTLIHDWVFENRAIYLTELNRLGGQVTLLDPHRTCRRSNALVRSRDHLPGTVHSGRKMTHG
jgi:UDP-N-acetylglucosamine enolpyruvyl transferase